MSHGTMLTMNADLTPSNHRPCTYPAECPRESRNTDHLQDSPRPPLRTVHAHIYRFGAKQNPLAINTSRQSIYANQFVPSCPLEQLPTHPALRKRKASHVPIVISQALIDRVSKDSPESKKPASSRESPGSSQRSSEEEQISLAEALKQPPRPRFKPIIIPTFAQPYSAPQQQELTPPLSASDTLLPLSSQLTWHIAPLTPTDSDCATPRASVIHIKAPPTPPKTMSRPNTGNSMATDGSMHGSQFESFPHGVAELSTSQHSFTSEMSQGEEKIAVDTQAQPRSNAYASPPQSAKTITSPTAEPRTPTAGSSNLSGLICNVHRCTGKEPRGLVGATTTVLGDKLYVFGGRSLSRRHPHMTSDLYELDLIHRHWSKIRTKGQVPSPRYFHSVCALGDNKLICYGGMSPAPQTSATGILPTPNAEQPDVVVMSDVHIYDIKSRAWTKIDVQDPPQGRYAHCAAVLPSTSVFSSSNAPLAAIHHNPSEGDNPNSGQLGVALDGTGGAEMVVVGGQDNANHYIEQISVFNLRSLKWTATNSLGRSCGAYRSVVAPFVGFPASKIGSGVDASKAVEKDSRSAPDANSMLIYSNYNFLDVKLELQVRTADGRLEEKPMTGALSPPGLRFPNGGVLNNHFVISGTYLTSSRQEYALWALDLRNMTWSRIDVGGSVFGQGSWNRGVLWPRRNTFVILGNRKRNLVEDYNHRRINFSNICLVELEAFGLYDNPRHKCPTSAYNSYSAPNLPLGMRPKNSLWSGGGRSHFSAAEELGKMAMGMKELADMDILTVRGERIPVNSHMLARRWGAYFISALRDGANSTQAASLGKGFDAMTIAADLDKDTNTIRPPATYRNSSVTITPSIATTYTAGTTLTAGSQGSAGTATLGSGHGHSGSIASGGSAFTTNGLNGGTSHTTDDAAKPFHAPSPASLPAPTRSRTLYLPHTAPTINALLHFLYTSSLPPNGHELSSPQILCSLLQLARPYRIDGLLEAVLQRLHESLDGRSAAAVFNACAMAAGGGRGTGFEAFSGGSVMVNEAELDEASDALAMERGIRRDTVGSRVASRVRGASERKNAFANAQMSGHDSTDVSEDETSGTDTESGSTTDGSDIWDDGNGNAGHVHDEEVWTGERSCVIGLQKRGLRGLMEGRRMRERGESSARMGPK